MKLFVNVDRLSRSCSVTYVGISFDVKICGWLLGKMVFFAFNNYLATKFHLNNLFAENYIYVLSTTWNDVSFYFVLNIPQVTLVFIFCKYLCYARKKPQYFTFTVRKFST